MKTVALREVASINPRSETVASDAEISFVGMAELNAESAVAKPLETRPFADVSRGYTIFHDRDVLAAKITPCWENGKVGQAQLDRRIGVGSTEFHVLRPGVELDHRYLLHYLRQPAIRLAGELRMTGSAGQKRVPVAFLRELAIPLPPFAEQRRIAAILDNADALRGKRRQVLAHLDTLVQSIFHDMFDAASYPPVSARELMPMMRNGLSPATSGEHSANVLTLSAVTQSAFDPTAIKRGLFSIQPPMNKRVTAADFMMCRGNGNKTLVGLGGYSAEDRPDLVFPDTVIAGRIDSSKVAMSFLNAAWKQRQVRNQIESIARTTNGTYKVNQQTLSSVSIPLPPLDLQHEFGSVVESVATQGPGKVAFVHVRTSARACAGRAA